MLFKEIIIVEFLDYTNNNNRPAEYNKYLNSSIDEERFKLQNNYIRSFSSLKEEYFLKERHITRIKLSSKGENKEKQKKN
eukprot:snap_masked-scaffold_19-processed-gene-2.26-mRNA-1 protein AED:1.00 eAED:1.00 QI:0/0/0/0/1/1/2/0/79